MYKLQIDNIWYFNANDMALLVRARLYNLIQVFCIT